MIHKKKGYAPVSEIEKDDELDEFDQSQPELVSMVEMLKQSAVRRQRDDFVSVKDKDDDNGQEMDDIEAQIDPNHNSNVGHIPNISRNNSDILNKTCKICSLCGIKIHIHVLLPLFIVLTSLSWIMLMTNQPQNTTQLFYLLILYIIQLWECILIHELGHALAGYVIGGHTDRILLWPLGGLAFTQFSKISHFYGYDT